MANQTPMSRVAFITGASAGIGKAVAIALVDAGWKVTLAARRDDLLEQPASQCGEENTLAVVTDVADPESVQRAFARTLEKFGRLDLLFNNAGRGAPLCRSRNYPTKPGSRW